MASQEGHDDIVKTLLGAGADVNITTSDVSDVMFYYYMYMYWSRCSVDLSNIEIHLKNSLLLL